MSEAKAEYYVVTPDGVVKPIDIAALVQPDDIPRDALWQSASGGHVCGECRDCKWWGGYDGVPPTDWGVCEREDSPGSLIEAGLRPESESGTALIETRDTFGCVQWEAKV